MTARVLPSTIILAVAVAGCVSDEKKLTTVSSSPFGQPARTQSASFKQAPQATQKVALRVNEIGQKVLRANTRLNQQVVFLTLGVAQPEIFHQSQRDSSAVYITEGLVNECKTDGELAAVLAQELAKMATEQMARTRPARALADRPPLMSPRVGNDIGGNFGDAGGTEQMILARYEKDRQQLQRPPPPPSADLLARSYLQSAGFNPGDLATIRPLLRKAEQNNRLEQQMTGKPQ
jgi:predicted Zn-dependent protease